MWLYNTTGRSVLLVGLFHASFNATVVAGDEFIPGPAGTTLVIATGIVAMAAVVLAVATEANSPTSRNRLSPPKPPGQQPRRQQPHQPPTGSYRQPWLTVNLHAVKEHWSCT